MRNEHTIQVDCINKFRIIYPKLHWRLFAIPNGGQRSKGAGSKLKSEGVLSGVWDLFLSVPRNGKGGLFIEMKHNKNDLTENQIRFMEENAPYYSFAVAYSTEEFLKAINEYLN